MEPADVRALVQKRCYCIRCRAARACADIVEAARTLLSEGSEAARLALQAKLDAFKKIRKPRADE